MTEADELIDRARSDPSAVMDLGQRHLREMGPDEDRERAITLRALSIAARATSDLQKSIEFASRAHDLSQALGDEGLAWLVLLTKSGSHAIAGESETAMKIIEDAILRCEDNELRARFIFQRGTMSMLAGQLMSAREDFESALPLFRGIDDKASISLTLENLGRTELELGLLANAEERLEEARRIAIEREEWWTLSGIEHSRGLLSAFVGDIPQALARLTESDRLNMSATGASAPQHVSRAEVLISVGRFEEALGLSEDIAAAAKDRQDIEHHGEALVVAARAALLSDQSERAARLASQAIESLTSQQRDAPILDARRILLNARLVTEGPSTELLDELIELVKGLEDRGVIVDAQFARLLAGRVALGLSDRSQARMLLEPLVAPGAAPVEIRLGSKLATASLARVDGDRRAALAAVRSGLRLLSDYQTALGATDLRIGLERHSDRLGALGLELALESGRPRMVLEWMELTRANALLYRPVVPEGDDATRQALSELRVVESQLRDPDRLDDRGLQRRRRLLQERIRDEDRVKGAASVAHRDFSVANLIDSLEERVLIEMAVVEGSLVAVVARSGRTRLHQLGPAEDLHQELSHLRFAMRRAARMHRPLQREPIEGLDGQLLAPLQIGDAPVVLSPPPEMMATPWSVFPSLAGRPLTVTPSGQIWRRGLHSTPGPRLVSILGGPDLESAGAEVRAISKVYTGARSIPKANVTEALDAMAEAGTIHIASHALFEYENPMFSSLRLSDGDLNVYDIERLGSVPETVILSACDSGYSDARPGEELAGLTSALLTMGARSVVASVGLVPDTSATTGLMVRLHEGLANGLAVSDALARAQEASKGTDADVIAAASFLSIGT